MMTFQGSCRSPSPPKFINIPIPQFNVMEEYLPPPPKFFNIIPQYPPSPPKFFNIPQFNVTEEYHSGSGKMTTRETLRLPSPPKFYVAEEYRSGSGDLSDGFGFLSLSPHDLSDGAFGIPSIPCTTTGRRRSQSTLQRSDGQPFQQWTSGDADAKTVRRQLGDGSERDAVRRRKPSSLPARKSKAKGDAPRMDLHIHINDNNIGSLSFGPPTPN